MSDQIEALAAFLATEHNYLDNMSPGYQWPLHPDDDGYRGNNSYVRLIPRHVQEHRRDDARRIMAFLASELAAAEARGIAKGREEAAQWHEGRAIEALGVTARLDADGCGGRAEEAEQEAAAHQSHAAAIRALPAATSQ